tara:strand:+ start:1513 stop:1902 length:390 start_codon:yes stop_codon:yes gene_type:complete
VTPTKAAARLLAAFLFVTVSIPALSQDAVAPVEGEIYIENVAPQRLTFGLSNDNVAWDRFQLDPDQVAVFGLADEWYFLILTEGVELRYRLKTMGSYRLYWNEADERWDLLTCSDPACGRTEVETEASE